MVAGAGAGDEQDAALPLQILGVRDRILIRRGDCRFCRNQPLLHTNHGYSLKLQSFHAVHSAGPDCLLAAWTRQGSGGEAGRFECVTCLTGQPAGPGSDPDRMRLDAGVQPRTNPFGKRGEFFFGCGHALRCRGWSGRPGCRRCADADRPR